jgi:hypothetical protein
MTTHLVFYHEKHWIKRFEGTERKAANFAKRLTAKGETEGKDFFTGAIQESTGLEPFDYDTPVTHINECLRGMNSGDIENRRKINKIAQETENEFVLADGCRLRKTPPGEKDVGKLLFPGDMIEFRDPCIDSIRLFRIRKVCKYTYYAGVEAWGFVLGYPFDFQSDNPAFAGDYVAQGGEFYSLFRAEKSRMFLVKRGKAPAQMRLF